MGKFQFQKATYDLEINDGKVYTIDFSDDAMLRYLDLADDVQKAFGGIGEDEFLNLDQDGRKELMDSQKESVKKVVEAFLGEGSFDEIYSLSGRSLGNLIPLIEHIMDEFNRRNSERIETKKAQYLKKKWYRCFGVIHQR